MLEKTILMLSLSSTKTINRVYLEASSNEKWIYIDYISIDEDLRQTHYYIKFVVEDCRCSYF